MAEEGEARKAARIEKKKGALLVLGEEEGLIEYGMPYSYTDGNDPRLGACGRGRSIPCAHPTSSQERLELGLRTLLL